MDTYGCILLYLFRFCAYRPKLDDGYDEYLMESVDENMLREWRRVRNTPWSYSRISRIFNKSPTKRAPTKSFVLTGNVNAHDSRKTALSLSYDCRMSMENGIYQNRPDCPRKRKNRLKHSRRVQR